MASVSSSDCWHRHMRAGRFAEAWSISDEVMRHSPPAPSAAIPRHLQRIWTGCDLAGRRVLVRCYHGLGDTIQYIRYMPLLGSIAREVIVWAQPTLLPLLSTVGGIDRLLPLHDGNPETPYDADVEIMELPHVFRTTLRTIPAALPYIHVEAGPRPLDGRRHIAVVAQGGSWNPERHVPHGALAPLFACRDVTWHSLDERRPMIETARTLRAMDLVISVDTMAAHLAGAMGVPTWILLHAEPDWRWMDDRDDSPWYPAARLFRRGQREGWEAVVARVCAALA